MAYTDAVIFHFRIMYLMKKSHITVHEDLVMSGIDEVMTYLKAKGVNKNTVQSLFVHQITPTGVMELITIDNSKDNKREPVDLRPPVNVVAANDPPPFSTPSSNVVSIAAARNKAAVEAAQSKPRVRLKTTQVEEKKDPVIIGGLYAAVQF